MKKRIIVAIYSNAELYPPTLNAVNELAKIYDQVIMIHRNHLLGTWKYSKNVIVVPHGRLMTARQQENASVFLKFWLFFTFTILLLAKALKYKPKCILLYDPIALFSFHLIHRLLSPSMKIWYHNHDVGDLRLLRKFSISWLALNSEKVSFKYLDIFTVPSVERLKYFPSVKFNGNCFVIPNYPSLAFFSEFYKPRKISNVIKLIFQGHVGPNHGLEEIIELLSRKNSNFDFQLMIKGPCTQLVRQDFEERAKMFGVLDKIIFYDITPYSEVPLISSSCHIGIGIHTKKDIMNLTLGTASNKLYEYAAVGLPILYYDSDHFNKILSRYDWAIATTVTVDSLFEKILFIVENYEPLSSSAHLSFIDNLNYEKQFNEIAFHLRCLLA